MSRETMTIADAARLLSAVGVSEREMSARLGKGSNFVHRICTGKVLVPANSVMPQLDALIRSEADRLRLVADSLLALLGGDRE